MLNCDNENSECCIRFLVMGRVNRLFCSSQRVAKALSIIYSLVETARRNQAHPYYYLKYLLDRIPEHPVNGKAENMDDMLPWSDEYRAYEKDQRKEDLKFIETQDEIVLPKTPTKKEQLNCKSA